MSHLLPWQRRLCVGFAMLLLTGFVAGCDDDSSNPSTDATDDGDTSADADADADLEEPTGGIFDCDPIDDAACSLPWPSNFYLADDSSTPTGQRLEFRENTLPKTEDGEFLDGSSWRRLDGYGVSTPIMFYFDKLDLTGLASERNMAPSVDPSHPIHLFEVQSDGSLEAVRFFIERDQRPETIEEAVIYLRPAKILEEGTRYIVAMTELKNTDGDTIEPDADFLELRDDVGGSNPRLFRRQPRFNEVFDLLEGHGINRDDLTLAWDFYTASDEALHGTMIAMRDKALAAIETNPPAITFDKIETYSCIENPGEDEPAYNDGIAFRVEGTFETPYFMKPAKSDATSPFDIPSIFNKDANGEIQQNGVDVKNYYAMIPCSAVGDDAAPAGLIQYGHGLLGSGSQVFGGFNKRIATTYNYIFFGGDWTGMAESDVNAVATVLQNMGKFAYVADRLHQGIIEFIVLGRVMKTVFADSDFVAENKIQINTDQYFYSGISQGGIFGATLMAVSPDLRFGHLGVPGANYSMLLRRSVDFNGYLGLMQMKLPNHMDQSITLALVQQLWDQTDPASYYKHLSVDPFPGNEPSHVILAPAKGDHQVSPLTNLIIANSNADVVVMDGWGRSIEHMGLSEQSYGSAGEPYEGSAVVMYDLGNPWPEPGNWPPDDSAFCWAQFGKPADNKDCSRTDCLECDPHGTPRYFPDHQAQMMHFFESGGEVIDVCNGNGCHFRNPSGWDRNPALWTDD